MSPACQLGPHATPMAMEGTSTGLGLCRCCRGGGSRICWSYPAWWTSHFQRITRSLVVQKMEGLHGFTMTYHPTHDHFKSLVKGNKYDQPTDSTDLGVRYFQTNPGGPMPQQTTLRELQVQVLPQAFGAALQKLAIMRWEQLPCNPCWCNADSYDLDHQRRRWHILLRPWWYRDGHTLFQSNH